jgi:hypothetical protein
MRRVVPPAEKVRAIQPWYALSLDNIRAMAQGPLGEIDA